MMRRSSWQLGPFAVLLMAAALGCTSNSDGTDRPVPSHGTPGEAGVLIPFAAAGSGLILQDDFGTLFLWDGSEGDAVPLELGPGVGPSTVLIGGPRDDLLLLWEPVEASSVGNLTLLDLSSGERRLMAADALADSILTSNRVMWSNKEGLVHIWEMDLELKTVLEASRTAPATGFAIGDRLVAWASRQSENGRNEIHVLDLETGERDLIEASGLVQHVVLTEDAAYLAWLVQDGARPGFYALDRTTGRAWRFLDDLGGMAIKDIEESNGFVVWRVDPDGGTTRPGYYDLANERLQFIEPAEGRSVLRSGVLGDWFFWIETRPGNGDAAGPPEVFLRPLR